MRSEVAMSGYIRIRVFQEEKHSMKKMAEERGVSLSGLIRDAVFDAPRTSKATNRERRI
ncbi:plasmid mobilization protein [Brucella thiophenivorans]|uniref:Ribbon-helix-helix, copG family protein n=1 Tax=Brucella thiophenivorans TaxID=571255 RepID=A0A256FEF9_9HYPH|nr:hypothetical protein [Brucella thiophenivorans]OYR13046.1 ribbon-helix-helix, copG family protein [Brucella thiophenivorans]